MPNLLFLYPEGESPEGKIVAAYYVHEPLPLGIGFTVKLTENYSAVMKKIEVEIPKAEKLQKPGDLMSPRIRVILEVIGKHDNASLKQLGNALEKDYGWNLP